jgi:uncharacterized protein YdhG (YjbR/CyaY superfamily)
LLSDAFGKRDRQECLSYRKQSMTAKPQTIDEYLQPLSGEKRSALEKLRRAIKSAAPKAEECISYQVPGFRLDGKLLVSFGAAAKHCSFYPGAHPLKTHHYDLKKYDTSKGTIRFPDDRPLPPSLVRKLVKTRIKEYAAKQRPAAKEAKRRG